MKRELQMPQIKVDSLKKKMPLKESSPTQAKSGNLTAHAKKQSDCHF